MSKSDDKILAEAKDRFKRAAEAEEWQRELSEDDFDFVGGRQWPEAIEAERSQSNRPTLTINRAPVMISQAVSAARRSNLSIAISAADGGDPETADIIAGMVRAIERTSHADQAYDAALEQACTGGMGYWRIGTKYAGPATFDQVITIDRIRNPFAVSIDPDADKYDKSDARFAFISDMVRREDLEKQYPDSKSELSDFTADGDDEIEWIDGDDRVRVVEYFTKSDETYTLAALSTGQVVELTSDIKAMLEALPDVTIERTREATRSKIEWRKLCGACVLEGPEEIPSQYIPIVPVYGPEELVDGRVTYRSLIRHAKDPMRQYNYWQSMLTEKIALAPKSPWLVTPRMVQGLERIWDAANNENRAYLPFNPDSGMVPSRVAPAPFNPAEIQQAAQAIDDIKACTGIFDASLGNQGPETSGVAIMARQTPGNDASFAWLDNLRRSVEFGGCIIVDMIPRVYDAPRMVQTLSDDGTEKQVEVNRQDPLTGEGVDLTSGTYQVAVSTGPAYATQREKASTVLLELVKIPAIAPIAAHMLAQQMDFPQARQLGKMLKRSLPPGLLDEDDPDAPQAPQQPQGPSPEDLATQAIAEAQIAQAQATRLKAEAESRKILAGIPGQEADARKTNLESAKLALELAAADGSLSAMIAQQVEREVQQAMVAMLMPAPPYAIPPPQFPMEGQSYGVQDQGQGPGPQAPAVVPPQDRMMPPPGSGRIA